MEINRASKMKEKQGGKSQPSNANTYLCRLTLAWEQ